MVTSQDGLVSVVIAAYDVADYLAETLDSVLAQDDVELEVVVVDDGSRDATGEIADAFAVRDARVRVIHQANAGLGGARNAGIAAARGAFLTFVDADDVLPAGALAVLTGALRGSGSDLAVGRVHRVLPDGSHLEPVWITESHAAAPLHGVTVDDHPLIIKNIVACNRLYRRAFWDERIGVFPVDVAYEDHVPMFVSYLAGARIDVLDEVTYWWRTRADGSSISQRKAEDSNFEDRLSVMELAWEAVSAESPEVRSAWLARALELDLAGYYRHAADASPQFRSRLQDAASHYLELADDDALRFVSVHRKVAPWLAASEHWAALDWLEGGERVSTLRRRGKLVAGWPTAEPGPVAARFDLDIPSRLLALSSYDTSARTALRRVTHTASSIEVELDVWLRGVKQPESFDEVSLELRVDDRPPHRVEARSTGRRALAVIDVAELRQWADGASGTVSVAVRYVWGDATDTVSLRAPFSRLPLARPGQSAGVRAVLGPDNTVALRLTRPPAAASGLRVGRGAAVATLTAASNGARFVRVPLPDRARRRISPRTSDRSRITWPDDEPTGVVVPGLLARRSPWRWEATARDEAVLVPRGPLLELTEAAVVDEALELTLRVRDRWRLDLATLRWFPGRAHARRGTITVRLDADDLATITVPTPLTATGPRSPAAVRFAWPLLTGDPLRWEIGGRIVRLRAGRRRGVILTVRKPRRR